MYCIWWGLWHTLTRGSYYTFLLYNSGVSPISWKYILLTLQYENRIFLKDGLFPRKSQVNLNFLYENNNKEDLHKNIYIYILYTIHIMLLCFCFGFWSNKCTGTGARSNCLLFPITQNSVFITRYHPIQAPIYKRFNLRTYTLDWMPVEIKDTSQVPSKTIYYSSYMKLWANVPFGSLLSHITRTRSKIDLIAAMSWTVLSNCYI